jgi:hypothetical protein
MLMQMTTCSACGARTAHAVDEPVTTLCGDCFDRLQADAVAPFEGEAERLGTRAAAERWVNRLLAGGMTLAGVDAYFDILEELCEARERTQEVPR